MELVTLRHDEASEQYASANKQLVVKCSPRISSPVTSERSPQTSGRTAGSLFTDSKMGQSNQKSSSSTGSTPPPEDRPGAAAAETRAATRVPTTPTPPQEPCQEEPVIVCKKVPPLERLFSVPRMSGTRDPDGGNQEDWDDDDE